MLKNFKRTLSLCFALISTSCFSQFNGMILDSQTKKPIPNVSISIDKDRGTISKLDGSFEIEIVDYPVIIAISHVAYHPVEIVIQTELQSGLNIYLDSKTIDIDEVVVNTQRVKRYLPQNNFYVLDYEFYEKKICLIGYENRRLSKGRLVILNEKMDTLSNISINKPESFYRDAFNNLHLITKDSVYQLYYRNGDLHMLYPTHRDEVPLEFFQLEFVDNSKFLFKIISEGGQSHDYLLIDTVNQTREIIKTVFDNKLQYQAKRPASYTRPEKKIQGRASVRDLSSVAMENMRSNAEMHFYSAFVINQPINSHMFRKDSTYVLFDNVNNRIVHYNNDFATIKTVKSKFPKHKQRDKQVIQDTFTKRFYWIYYQGSKVVLGEIDPDSGKIVGQRETPNFPFIENIIIRNERIWFTYQPRIGLTTRSLFRMN